MNFTIYEDYASQFVGLINLGSANGMSHLADVVRASGGECAGRDECGGAPSECVLSVRARGTLALTDDVVGRPALWPPWRSWGGASRTPRPTVRTRRSMSLPWQRVEDNAPYRRYDCWDAKRGRAVCPHTAVNGRDARSPSMDVTSASLPWRCLSISINTDVSNEANDVNIVNVLNKITSDIAFEGIL